MTDPAFLDSLAADLSPVRPLSARIGWLHLFSGLAATVAAVAVIGPVRPDIWDMTMTSETLLGQALWLALCLASGATAAAMAQPAVGADRSGWRWALLPAAALPLAALLLLVRDGSLAWESSMPAYGAECMGWALASGSLIALALVLWLRRGAPVAPERAGLLVGLSAGAGGSFAYGLHCTIDGVLHNGLWHAAPVAIAALVGRLALPRLLRW